MIDFAGLQSVIKERLEKDRAINVVEAEGFNLEEALTHASLTLNIPIRRLEYEVLLQKTAFLGIGENICKIRVSELTRNKKEDTDIEVETIDDLNVELLDDTDGSVFVQRRADGVYLKVTPPIGEGSLANLKQAENLLEDYYIENYDRKIVSRAVDNPSSTYCRIGDCEHTAGNETRVVVEISSDEMNAYITVSAPRKGGIDFSYEEYRGFLTKEGVTNGINEDFLKNFADKPIYRQKICVATGKKAIDGMNSHVQYYFETDITKSRITESSNGKIDFREINTIQNVLKGERLAKKVPPEEGIDGFTVTGKTFPAQAGKDTGGMPLGKNVSLDPDGLTILSDINGQVTLTNGKINVELVHVVEGSVNLKTGNIIFLGNVVIKGNVEEGFYVKAAGSIEVNGSVDKASLSADGEIFIKNGINGKEGAKIHSKKSIAAKFIENADIEARERVVVSDGILNSTVSAGKEILCNGKRASIIGGRLCAGELINAKILGSPQSSTETILEVGYDPDSKRRMEELTNRKEELNAEFADIQLNLQTLHSIKEQRKTLSEDKEAYLVELTQKKTELSEEMETLNKEIDELRTLMESISFTGRVCSSAKVCPGVIVCIKDKKYTVRNEYKAINFILQDGKIIAEANVSETKKRK
ncbi:MAG: FapA family protein [Spirochaetaceae bacterium]|jgi:uncharacterized protein (DUF342 family)|nr:FapA family protein [Spirochaetaceae bacterium]